MHNIKNRKHLFFLNWPILDSIPSVYIYTNLEIYHLVWRRLKSAYENILQIKK